MARSLTVYFYDPETKEYAGTAQTALDPVASQREGRDVFLMPPNSTLIAPGILKDGYKKVWTGDYWDCIETFPSVEEQADIYRAIVNVILSRKAQEMGYDGVLSILSYIASTNPKWKAEAVAFSAWRDAVWAAAFAFLDDFEDGKAERVTDAEFVALLPVMPEVKYP